MNENLKETRRQGTVLHPLKLYRMYDEAGKINVPYHWQETEEILYMRQGSLKLRIGDDNYIGKPGDIFYINPRELHEMQALTPDCFYLAFVFPLSWLKFDQADEAEETCLKPLYEQRAHIVHSLEERVSEEIRILLEEVTALYESEEEGAWLGIKADLLKFYYYMYSNGLVIRSQKEPSEKTLLLLEISQYIGKHCHEKLSLKQLGDEFHMSPKYFSVFFQKHFHKNLTEHITSIRIEKAKKLLLESDADMEQIALRAGFTDSSYFIRVFRQTTGMTPGRYRKIFF